MLGNHSDCQHNKHPDIPVSPPGPWLRRWQEEHDAASQEDHDSSYVCDSEYSRCHLPAAARHFPELLQPGACWLLLSGSGLQLALLAATSLQSHLTSSGRSPPGLVLLQEGEAGLGGPCPVLLS